ncbi:MAG: hypothetical protein RR224_11105, partial [Clostridia bacterium]
DALNQRLDELTLSIDEKRNAASKLHERLRSISQHWIEAVEHTVIGSDMRFGDATLDGMYQKSNTASTRLLDSLHNLPWPTLENTMSEDGYWLLQAQNDLDALCRTCFTFEDKL